MSPVKDAYFRFMVGVTLVSFLFIASTFGVVATIRPHNGLDPALVTALKLSPVIPILLYGVVAFLYYRRLDEYHRARVVKVMALVGSLTILSDLLWNIAETVGAPPLGATGLLSIMIYLYGVIAFLFRLEMGVAEKQIGAVSRYLSWLAIPTLSVAGAVAYLDSGFEPAAITAAVALAFLVITALRLGPSTGLV